jgi:hypothetical protein
MVRGLLPCKYSGASVWLQANINCVSHTTECAPTLQRSTTPQTSGRWAGPRLSRGSRRMDRRIRPGRQDPRKTPPICLPNRPITPLHQGQETGKRLWHDARREHTLSSNKLGKEPQYPSFSIDSQSCSQVPVPRRRYQREFISRPPYSPLARRAIPMQRGLPGRLLILSPRTGPLGRASHRRDIRYPFDPPSLPSPGIFARHR